MVGDEGAAADVFVGRWSERNGCGDAGHVDEGVHVGCGEEVV